MREIAAIGELAAVFKQFQSIGGVLDIVLLDSEERELPDPDLHRQAAISTLQCIGDRWSWPLAIQKERARGWPISIPEFLGPRYDLR